MTKFIEILGIGRMEFILVKLQIGITHAKQFGILKNILENEEWMKNQNNKNAKAYKFLKYYFYWFQLRFQSLLYLQQT